MLMKTTKPKGVIIDLNNFSPAERKMYDLGGYIGVYKDAPEPIRKAETAVHYYQCDSKPLRLQRLFLGLFKNTIHLFIKCKLADYPVRG